MAQQPQMLHVSVFDLNAEKNKTSATRRQDEPSTKECNVVPAPGNNAVNYYNFIKI